MNRFQQLAEAIRNGDASASKEHTSSLLDEGFSPQQIMDDGLFKGMAAVGELFKEDEIFIPEVIMASKAMQAGVDMVEPLLLEGEGLKNTGTVVLGTVKSDLHDLGKNLVGLMLRGAGFRVVDLGVDVSVESFIEAARQEDAQILAMSALLTTTMNKMKEVIEALEAAGLKDRIKTMVGGCVITQDFADKISADAYAENAGEAVAKAKALVSV